MMHKLTLDELETAVRRDDGSGFCLACGHEPGHWCEPDMRRHTCENCGKPKVYGAEELLFMFSH